MLIGYARVSTTEQETALQLDALQRVGCFTIYEEKTSSVGARPQLQRALAGLRPGHVLVVYKLDRVARSLRDLLNILERLERVGAGFRSLTEPIDTSSAAGVLMLQLLGAVGEFERSLIRERSIAGQLANWRRGGRVGRPKILTDEQEGEVLRRLAVGESKRSVGRALGVSYSVVRRIEVEQATGLKKTGLGPVLKKYV